MTVDGSENFKPTWKKLIYNNKNKIVNPMTPHILNINRVNKDKNSQSM